VLDFGWSVVPNKNLYLVVAPQFQFLAGGGGFILPVGIQYDIALPVKGLYIYPRLLVGYGYFSVPFVDAFGLPQTLTASYGFLLPEVGIKYIFRGRWNFGGEVFSLPIAFNGDGAKLSYRVLASAGVNF